MKNTIAQTGNSVVGLIQNGGQPKRNLANWKSNLSDFPRILQKNKKKEKKQERKKEMTQNMQNRSQNSNIYTEGCPGKNRKKRRYN